MKGPNTNPPLPVVPRMRGEVPGDDAWTEQRGVAMQIAIACQIYHSDFGHFPNPLSDVLEIFDHIPREKSRLRRHFTFKDPATNESHEWIYIPNAKFETQDLLVVSPPSINGLRIVCTATGRGAIIEEAAYQKMKTTEG